jgi:hypothetical protein
METQYTIFGCHFEKGLLPVRDSQHNIVEFPSRDSAESALRLAESKGWTGIGLVIPTDIAYNFEGAPSEVL